MTMKRTTEQQTSDEQRYPGAAIDNADDNEKVNEKLPRQYTRDLNNNPRSTGN